jgi:ABC-type enterochelin transport system substrate-binding protein
MKILFFALTATMILLTGCGKSDSTKSAGDTNSVAKNDSGNPLTAPADYLGAVVDAKKHSEKVVDVTALDQAIQLFNVQEGRLPKTLDELVPNYIGKLPPTPFGTKVVYDAKAGTVKVVKQ